MSKETKIQKILSKTNIRDRDLLLFLTLHFIHDKGMTTAFLEYLETAKRSVT